MYKFSENHLRVNRLRRISKDCGKEYKMNYQITNSDICRYEEHLIREEKAPATIEKYMRDVRAFTAWLSGREVTKQQAADWKEHLAASRYMAVTINSMLSAINSFFRFMGWEDCRVRFLRVQRRSFRDQSRNLNLQEYKRLVQAANERGNQRLSLLLETICGTGIRVSELRYITMEAVKRGRAEISLKGKLRIILLPEKLCKKLLAYGKKQKIPAGELFLTKTGKSLSRRQIWAEMKRLSRQTGIQPDKVFPHNLRHLFARSFYKASGDIVKLADILGHSSIDTTRIYLISTGAEHMRQLNGLRLVS